MHFWINIVLFRLLDLILQMLNLVIDHVDMSLITPDDFANGRQPIG